jgi:molybdopterin-dependent oxidoreductase iron-sulfur protein
MDWRRSSEAAASQAADGLRARRSKTGGDGTGAEAMSERTRTLRPKNSETDVARSICPYCGVGCGQLVYHRAGKVVSIEGDPQSPISRGHLCPKGAASFELVTHSERAAKVTSASPPRHSRPMSGIALNVTGSRKRIRSGVARRGSPRASADSSPARCLCCCARSGLARSDSEPLPPLPPFSER